MPIQITRTGIYYNVTEAAQQRNVAPRTIRQWLVKGLPALKVGQGNTNSIIHIDDLMAWQPAEGGRPKRKAQAANEAALTTL